MTEETPRGDRQATSPVEFQAGKGSGGQNPRNGSGVKQSRRGQQGENPRGSEKDRGGKALGWNWAIRRLADS